MKIRLLLSPILLLLPLALAMNLEAQSSWDLYQVEAAMASQPPVLDGVLDEAVWADATVISTFVQQEPNEGAPATERTELRVLYDAENL